MSSITDQDPASPYIPYETQEQIKRLSVYIVALITSLFTVVPLYVMFLMAFERPTTVFSGTTPNLLPVELTLHNFIILLTTTETVTFAINSIIITAGTMLIATTVAVFAGYGLTRFEFSGKNLIAKSIMLSYMFSAIVLAIPIYIIYVKLGLLDTRLGVILGLTALLSPFNIWLMWQYFETVPLSLEERAWTEGASRWRTVWDIVIPVARPGIITAAIFSFSAGWNDYTLSKIVLSEVEMYTLPVGTALFLGKGTGWGETMAVSVLICIPPFLIALFLQKYLLMGINIGET